MGSISDTRSADVELRRVSLILNELSDELKLAEAKRLRERERVQGARPVMIDEADRCLHEAELLYGQRRRMERAFGDHIDLLHDPALDILLYLFIASRRHQEVSVSSACHAAATPATTGLRYIAKLTDRGLVRRTDDPFDRRRHLLSLTEAGESLVQRFLDKL